MAFLMVRRMGNASPKTCPGPPKQVLTSLLVSPSVYQEVQYNVQCMPRLFYDDALLWEPLCVLKRKEDDEWASGPSALSIWEDEALLEEIVG